MNITLNLKNHCIQTEIKRQYNKLISKYFKAAPPEEKKALEVKIDLLQNALNNLDFELLRSSYPALSGGSDEEIDISLGPDSKPLILINGRPIDETY